MLMLIQIPDVWIFRYLIRLIWYDSYRIKWVYHSVCFTSIPSAVDLRIFGNEINPKFPKFRNFWKNHQKINFNQLSNLPTTYQTWTIQIFIRHPTERAMNIPPRFFFYCALTWLKLDSSSTDTRTSAILHLMTQFYGDQLHCTWTYRKLSRCTISHCIEKKIICGREEVTIAVLHVSVRFSCWTVIKHLL